MSYKDAMTQVARFNTLTMATYYKNRAQNRWIVLGDNNQFWVTTRRAAMVLVGFGYELLEG